MSNLYKTDAYKFSMAEAGFPLRMETFYLCFRRGGLQYIPIDIESLVRSWLPRQSDVTNPMQLQWLGSKGYTMTPAMWQAIYSPVKILAAPKGSWVNERESIASFTCPSFLASWMEQNVIRLHFIIQLATKIKLKTVESRDLMWIGEEHKNLILWVYEQMGEAAPKNMKEDVDYRKNVTATVAEIAKIVGGTSRFIECGGRSAITEEMHGICLEACKAAGLIKTANVYQALRLGMQPVGTTGHEHIMRFGGVDLDSFRAMRDRRPGIPGHLLDTNSTMKSGIPAALQCYREQPHKALTRYDSGNWARQYLFALETYQDEFKPIHFFEDGLDAPKTSKLELLRMQTDCDPDHFQYGYGGHFVLGPAQLTLTRDRVQAVYKLSDSGGIPCRKRGDDKGLGKSSIPGKPVIWRSLSSQLPFGVIAQEGETPHSGYVLLTDNPGALERINQSWTGLLGRADLSYQLSPQTSYLVGLCDARNAA